MENSPLGSGMGTSGLVGQISTINTMAADRQVGILLLEIILLHFILPGLISYIIYKPMYKKGLIKDNDMKINF